VLETIEDRVKARLIKYLGRDDTGIREVVLKMFLDGGTFTTSDVYKHLHEKESSLVFPSLPFFPELLHKHLVQ